MAVGYTLIRPDELDATLVERWHSIRRSGLHHRSPYFCPEFAQSVGKVRSDARVVVIENDQRVVGFFPFQGGALGFGRPIGGPLSDFHGVIAEPSSDWALSDLLRAAKLSVWVFDHQTGNDERFAPHVTARFASPQIDLNPGYDAYVQGRRAAGSDYIPKTEGLARKLAREVGNVELVLSDTTSGVFETLTMWKSQQYLEAGISDVFAVPWTGALLRQILMRDGPEFSGLCSVLKVDGRIVAGHIGMRSSDVFHYWFPAYDPSYAKFSTGIILLLRMADALAAQGVRTIDLGKGDSAYKQRLMTGAVDVKEGYVERASMLAKARHVRRRVEALALEGGARSVFQLPLRIARRLERASRFR